MFGDTRVTHWFVWDPSWIPWNHLFHGFSERSNSSGPSESPRLPLKNARTAPPQALFGGNLAKWLSNYKKDGEVIILLVKATWKHRVGSIIPSFHHSIIPSFAPRCQECMINFNSTVLFHTFSRTRSMMLARCEACVQPERAWVLGFYLSS